MFSAALWNLKVMRKNPRVWICFGLAFLSAFMMTRETIETSRFFEVEIQITEPFIWCFSDGGNILFASLALMLVLTQMPYIDHNVLFRIGRKKWIGGQIISAILISFFYTMFLLVATMCMAGGRSFWDNQWSDTATVLSYSDVKILQVSRRVIKSTTPYFCMVQIFLLTNLYMLMLTMMKLFVTLHWGQRAGLCAVIIISLYGFLLTPDWFMIWLGLEPELQYYANLLAAWGSPLQHASYGMHSFGYDDLPQLWVSYTIMVGIVIVLTAGSGRWKG